MIQQYQDILRSIEDVQRKSADARERLDLCRMTITEQEGLKIMLERERTKAMEEERQLYIGEEVSKAQQPLDAKMQRLQKQISDLNTRYSKQVQAIEAENYNLRRQQSFMLINQALGLLANLAPQFVGLIDESITYEIKQRISEIQITDTLISNLFDRVENSAEISEVQTRIPILERTASWLFLPKQDPFKEKKSRSSIRMVGLGIKAVLFIGAVVLNPVIFTIPYSIFIIRGVRIQSLNTKTIQGLIYPYEFLNVATNVYRDELLAECQAIKDEDIAKAEDLFNTDRAVLDAEVNSLQDELRNLQSKVIANLNEVEVKNRVERQYAAKVLEAEQKLTRSREQFTNLQTTMSGLTEQLQNLRRQQAELRTNIEANYINLSKVGSDPMLLKSFFLGFDEASRIIELNYAGETTMVMYSGDDGKAVTPFINMMFIQYYTNMLITNLHIDVVDFENAGMDHQSFRYKALKDVITLVGNQEEQGALITDLYKDLKLRSETIMTATNNIEEYNKMMLARESIPMDYRIVIFQTLDLSLMNNATFLQLCRQGASYGIVPIIFVNVSTMPTPDRTSKMSREEVQGWLNLASAIPHQFFNYNSESGEVTAYTRDYKRDWLEYLQGLVREE